MSTLFSVYSSRFEYFACQNLPKIEISRYALLYGIFRYFTSFKHSYKSARNFAVKDYPKPQNKI